MSPKSGYIILQALYMEVFVHDGGKGQNYIIPVDNYIGTMTRVLLAWGGYIDAGQNYRLAMGADGSGARLHIGRA